MSFVSLNKSVNTRNRINKVESINIRKYFDEQFLISGIWHVFFSLRPLFFLNQNRSANII